MISCEIDSDRKWMNKYFLLLFYFLLVKQEIHLFISIAFQTKFERIRFYWIEKCTSQAGKNQHTNFDSHIISMTKAIRTNDYLTDPIVTQKCNYFTILFVTPVHSFGSAFYYRTSKSVRKYSVNIIWFPSFLSENL